LVSVIDHLVTKEQGGRYKDYKIVLVGHSEGTLLSAMASQKSPDKVDSIVLICPFVTPMEEILMSQAREMQRSIDETPGCFGSLLRCVVHRLGLEQTHVQSKLIARIKASEQPTISFYCQKIPARWFRDHFSTNYQHCYKHVSVPTFVVVAEFDCQCDPDDGTQIGALIPSSKVAVVSRMTHLLRKEETNTGFSGYPSLLKQPMDVEVLSLLTEWCQERSKVL